MKKRCGGRGTTCDGIKETDWDIFPLDVAI